MRGGWALDTEMSYLGNCQHSEILQLSSFNVSSNLHERYPLQVERLCVQGKNLSPFLCNSPALLSLCLLAPPSSNLNLLPAATVFSETFHLLAVKAHFDSTIASTPDFYNSEGP